MTKTEDNQSYQELKKALDIILVKLQNENTDIDEAIALHAQGQEILSQLDAYLQKIAKASEIQIKKIN